VTRELEDYEDISDLIQQIYINPSREANFCRRLIKAPGLEQELAVLETSITKPLELFNRHLKPLANQYLNKTVESRE
jgi:hypothetical protein